MYELNLTKGYKTIVDEDIYDLLCNTKWCYAHGYAVRRVDNKIQYLHNFILPKVKGLIIDHIDCDGLNNQRYNLRYATKSQNAANAKVRSGTSIYKGVSWDKQMNKWRASINYHNRRRVIGLFDKERWAAMAYDIAAKDIYKDFSLLNFKNV